jgi:chemotaxis protein CheD
MCALRSTSSNPATYAPPSTFGPRKRIIGIAELEVSANADDVLVTYALGSCLGITMYDATARIGGLVHVMLPTSELNPERAAATPATFVDTGVAALLEACTRLGAARTRLTITAAGGAARTETEDKDQFQIGRRNFVALRQLLWKQGLLLRAHDVGGAFSRNVSLAIGTGEVHISRYDNASLRSTP